MASFEFRMALVGPSRVGKTSLVTSMLSQAEDLLAGTPVSLKPGDGPTEMRITENRDELRACLLSDEFNAATLSSTQDLVEFRLDMGVGKSKVRFELLDFPGEWLRPDLRNESGWEQYHDWLAESSVLVVPMDATLVMEAMSTHREKGHTIKNLQIDAVTSIARDWAKARAQAGEPSLLLFSPVKCESYFTDNRGKQDLSEKLYNAAMSEHLYGDVLRAVRRETRGNGTPLRIEYHPVGTLGCVDFLHGHFDEQGVFSAKYGRRAGAGFKPYGADGLLVSIAKHAARGASDNPGNFFSKLWKWLTGESKSLHDAMQSLANTDFHSRVRVIQER